MVHAKLIRVDNQVLTFGSTNLNKQAMEKLLELNVFMKNYDEDFSEVLEESIQNNITDATRIRNGSNIKFNPIRAMLEQIV
ncbi:MAG: phospholipase D-like domain-containing protein, partial [Clostridia bacterium]|nr:phospholipase D-like domain-containing protein [Clostridia bacterium]